MGEDKLAEWIAKAATEWSSLTKYSEPTLPYPPPDWSVLFTVPDEKLAEWARLLLKQLYDATDEVTKNPKANAARQRFSEMEAVLGTLGEMLFFSRGFVPGGRDPFGWLGRLWTVVAGGGFDAKVAAESGIAPSLGLYGRSVSARTGSSEYITLKRYAVGAMELFEADGLDTRPAAEKVSSILADHKVLAGLDVIRTTWRASVKAEEYQYFGMRASDALMLGWLSHEVLESWQQEAQRRQAKTMPPPEFASWAVSMKSNLLTVFVPRILGEQAQNWNDTKDRWGSDKP